MSIDQMLISADGQILPDPSQDGLTTRSFMPGDDSFAIGTPSLLQHRTNAQTDQQVDQWLRRDRALITRLNQRGTRQRDRLVGGNQADTLNGLQGHDVLIGKGAGDRLLGQSGNDQLIGGNGDDVLLGGKGRDRLNGGRGDDILEGGRDRDRYQGGGGADVFRTRLKDTSRKLKQTDRIQRFEDGQDRIDLKGISFDQVEISQGTGRYQNHTLIQHQATGKYLFVVENIDQSAITAADIVGAEASDNSISEPTASEPTASEPIASDPSTSDPATPLVSVSQENINLGAVDLTDEAAVQALGGATITIGSQRIYTGYRQASSSNQDSVVVSFDDTNPANNWVRTDYEVTGADSRGYGLFWSGTNLYGVFSVDGTQGTQNQDFRRASNDAATSWIRSYGRGGGAKIAVVARLDVTTGALLDAAYISAVLTDGKTNSLRVVDFSVNASGNVLVQSDSRFYPRNVDGSPMLNVGNTPAPFDYTVELTPDLNQVISTSAVGVS